MAKAFIGANKGDSWIFILWSLDKLKINTLCLGVN